MAKHRGVKFLRLSGGRTVVRWRDPVSGKQVQRDCEPLGLTNDDKRRRWAIAKAGELRDIKARLARGSHATERVEVATSQADYLASFANKNTLSAKLSPLAGIAEFLKQQGIRTTQDITPQCLAAWANHVRRPGNPHAVGTRNWYLVAAGSWLRWARELGTLPRVMPEEIRSTLRRQKPPSEAIEIMRAGQVRQLLRACIAHDAAESTAIAPLVLTTLLTGCRFAEARGLRWEEVDIGAKEIRLPAARVKTKAARTITLSESPTVALVMQALALRGASVRGRVFTLERASAEAARARTHSYDAPRWTWHMLRRTCGSVLVCGGLLGPGSTFLAAKRLGHSVAIAEKHYLGSMTDLPRDATTIEQALGIEAECREIVRSIGGIGGAQAIAE